jgi:hypothetical protein
MTTMTQLFKMLREADRGAKIVSSNELTELQIAESQACGRFTVDDDGFGFALILPRTIEFISAIVREEMADADEWTFGVSYVADGTAVEVKIQRTVDGPFVKSDVYVFSEAELATYRGGRDDFVRRQVRDMARRISPIDDEEMIDVLSMSIWDESKAKENEAIRRCIPNWSQYDRQAIAEWAGAILFVASDNEGVEVPPIPTVASPFWTQAGHYRNLEEPLK